MTALTAARNTPQLGTDPVVPVLAVLMAASAKVYQGGIVCLSAGYGQAAAPGLGLIALGRARTTVDNSTGSAGAKTVEVERGIFQFANGDTIVQADVGKVCYLLDDQTVTKGDGGGAARCLAGRIFAVDSAGVWVEVGVSSMPAGTPATMIVAIPVPALAAVANAGVYARFTPGFPGRIVSVAVQNTTVVSTAAKLATLQTAVAGVNTTGGAVALTSANQTPVGANVPGSAITAGNAFTAAQEITVVASGVTAFAEGAAVILLTLAGA